MIVSFFSVLAVNIQSKVYAADVDLRNPSVRLGPLDALKNLEITDLLSFVIRGLFVIAGMLALLYLLLGGMAWITSGGNKESVDKARDKIQAAVIGLIVIVGVLAIVTLLEKALNIGLGLSMPIQFPKLTP